MQKTGDAADNFTEAGKTAAYRRKLMKRVSYIAFLFLTVGLLASCASGPKFSAMQAGAGLQSRHGQGIFLQDSGNCPGYTA